MTSVYYVALALFCVAQTRPANFSMYYKRYITTSGVTLFYAQSITPLQHYKGVMVVMIVMFSVLPTHLQPSERSDQSPLPEAGD